MTKASKLNAKAVNTSVSCKLTCLTASVRVMPSGRLFEYTAVADFALTSRPGTRSALKMLRAKRKTTPDGHDYSQ